VDPLLLSVAKDYVRAIETIERLLREGRTAEAREWEHYWVALHGELMRALDRAGITYQDRHHATRIAADIVRYFGEGD
jgi:hypothetical protein